MNRAEKRRQKKLSKKGTAQAPQTPSPALPQTLACAIEHHNAGRLTEAEALYQQVLQVDPKHPDALHLLGLIAKQTGRNADAVELIRRALAVAPHFAAAHNNLGLVLMDLGDPESAIASYRKAVTAAPDYAEAYRHLSVAKKFRAYDDDVQAMEKAYEAAGQNAGKKMHLAFALGKAFEDLGRYDQAFEYFAEGNALKRKTYNYDIRDHFKVFENLKATFDAALFDRFQGGGCADDTPIFVLGMPRSGTSLVEQILASHSQVYGGGELQILDKLGLEYFGGRSQDAYTGNVCNAADGTFEKLGAAYLQQLRRLDPQTRFITDKMPDNCLNIGLIKLALPNAKVIHCKRSPQDTGLSLFKSYFPDLGHYYAYDLQEIGQYYRGYADVMEHWHRVLPGFVYDVQYEDLVADQENQTRALLDHCGLEWDPACIAFHKTARTVTTNSTAQVRRPMYASSVEAWKRYEEQLAPLINSLQSN